MSTLANLTNEEFALLVEVLEKEEQELQARPDETPARQGGGPASRRLEILRQLLEKARVERPVPTPDDVELREVGSYF